MSAGSPTKPEITTGVTLVSGKHPELFPSEQAIISSFQNPEAKQRFQAGREAARLALAKLSPKLTQQELPRAASGAVVWPSGFCGSISHKRNLAVAATARLEHFSTLGVDLEQVYQGDAERLIKRIGSASEIAWADRQSDINLAASVIFCCKESALKAIASRLNKRLLLTEVQLIPQQANSEFFFLVQCDQLDRCDSSQLSSDTAPFISQARLCEDFVISLAWQRATA